MSEPILEPLPKAVEMDFDNGQVLFDGEQPEDIITFGRRLYIDGETKKIVAEVEAKRHQKPGKEVWSCLLYRSRCV